MTCYAVCISAFETRSWLVTFYFLLPRYLLSDISITGLKLWSYTCLRCEHFQLLCQVRWRNWGTNVWLATVFKISRDRDRQRHRYTYRQDILYTSVGWLTAERVTAVHIYGRCPVGLFSVLWSIPWLLCKHLLLYTRCKLTPRQQKETNKRTASSVGEYRMCTCMRPWILSCMDVYAPMNVYMYRCICVIWLCVIEKLLHYDSLFSVLWFIFHD